METRWLSLMPWCVCDNRWEYSLTSFIQSMVLSCTCLNKLISSLHFTSGNKKSSCFWEVSERCRDQRQRDFVYGWPRIWAEASSVLVWIWDTDRSTGEVVGDCSRVWKLKLRDVCKQNHYQEWSGCPRRLGEKAQVPIARNRSEILLLDKGLIYRTDYKLLKVNMKMTNNLIIFRPAKDLISHCTDNTK